MVRTPCTMTMMHILRTPCTTQAWVGRWSETPETVVSTLAVGMLGSGGLLRICWASFIMWSVWTLSACGYKGCIDNSWKFWAHLSKGGFARFVKFLVTLNAFRFFQQQKPNKSAPEGPPIYFTSHICFWVKTPCKISGRSSLATKYFIHHLKV
jgi:hypothetical protein